MTLFPNLLAPCCQLIPSGPMPPSLIPGDGSPPPRPVISPLLSAAYWASPLASLLCPPLPHSARWSPVIGDKVLCPLSFHCTDKWKPGSPMTTSLPQEPRGWGLLTLNTHGPWAGGGVGCLSAGMLTASTSPSACTTPPSCSPRAPWLLLCYPFFPPALRPHTWCLLTPILHPPGLGTHPAYPA